MSNKQQKPLTAEEIFKKFDINPSFQNWKQLVARAVNFFVKQQTAQLRQELEQEKKERLKNGRALADITGSYNQCNRQRAHLQTELEHQKIATGNAKALLDNPQINK